MLAEWKEVGGAATYDNKSGVKLVTASNRRNSPQCLDSVIHHNNLLKNILVSIAIAGGGRGSVIYCAVLQCLQLQ